MEKTLVLPRPLLRVAVAVAAIAALIVVAFPALPSDAAAVRTEVVLTPAETTWTTSRAPKTPMAGATYLSFTRTADRAFIKFDTSKLGNVRVVGATLEVLPKSTMATSGGVQVYPVTVSWSAKTLTDSNRPADSAHALNSSLLRPNPGTRLNLPLVDLATISTTKATSFMLRYSQPYVGNRIYNTAAHPVRLRLTVESIATPSTPTASPTPKPTVVPSPTASPTPSATPDPGASLDHALPFTASGAIDPSRKVFAHYFPPYPISLDNQAPATDYYSRNYLTATGENGKHAAYGGLLRDRPVGRAPLSGDWQLKDLETEVTQAKSAGLDGFTVDVLSLSGRNWDTTARLMKAASNVGDGFVIVPNLDMTSSAGAAGIETVSAKLAELYSSGSAYRLADGRYVLSSFKAENQSPEWWTQLKSTLASRYGFKIALISVLLDSSVPNMTRYAPVSYALGDWGTRNADGVLNRPNRAATAHSLGVKWMPGIGIQDVRPNQGVYAEAAATLTLRENWEQAIAQGADMVQLVTWNDYSEGTSMAPSVDHGSAFLDINGYYLLRFKSGATPAVATEGVYITHRVQEIGAAPTAGQSLLMKPTLGGSKTAPRDEVEVMTFLKSAAQVKVVIGGQVHSYTAAAGQFIQSFPLETGTISADVVRAGKVVVDADSVHVVEARPDVQDLSYYAVGSD
ncbi:endo-1,3-alpha-glucanase family glycosylhydrolase [Leifsonia sp. Leaf264]|uniref:endo-1,3-alpha-glucanase family glycosylhydrolase n=1 Tax=Leifsonia sp. Leaf264 TaxID=1736314 RepID=UPI00138F4641|nr:endo-1,3-alpha-glucanase family glycosylhydrolase [Leifsonia sp. Leaf264]